MTMALRPDVAAYLALSRESGLPPLYELPVSIARAALDQFAGSIDAPPVELTKVRDISVTGGPGAVRLRAYDSRETRDGGPIVLFFHGGGFAAGSIETHDSLCRYLALRLDLPVVSVGYRLSPEHSFSEIADDACRVVRWIGDGGLEPAWRATELIVCGDSAGGHLAILLAQQSASGDLGIPIIAQWVLYPFMGAGTEWDSCREHGEGYILTRTALDRMETICGSPSCDDRYDLLARDVPPDIPLLIHTCSHDPLRDAAIAYANKAQAAGARVVHLDAEGMIHGFANMRRAMPSANAELDRFIDEACVLSRLHVAGG